MEKKLAVIMPTYNAVLYLKDSIESVLNQTFCNFDLYIFDDYSTDNTEKIISEYQDSRIHYRKNPENYGIAKTLNKGLDELLSQYEYIARMDADDWCFPERFQKQLDYLEQHQQLVLCGTQGYWLKDITQNPNSGWVYPVNHHSIEKILLFAASFGHSSVVFRSSFFQKYNFRYNENISTCEDWELWIRIVKIGNVANLPDFLMKYRVVPTSNHRSEKNKEIHLKERSNIIANYWKTFGINLSPEQVFTYYYKSDPEMKQNFISELKILIDSFNQLFLEYAKDLEDKDRRKFSYLLIRKIADFRKRSNIDLYNPILWKVLLTKVKFANPIILLKSQIY